MVFASGCTSKHCLWSWVAAHLIIRKWTHMQHKQQSSIMNNDVAFSPYVFCLFWDGNIHVSEWVSERERERDTYLHTHMLMISPKNKVCLLQFLQMARYTEIVIKNRKSTLRLYRWIISRKIRNREIWSYIFPNYKLDQILLLVINL